MTDNEREEFIYDLAYYKLKRTSKAGIFAHALDRLCDLLAKNTDEQLIEMAPDNLIIVKKEKKKSEGGFGFH